MGLVVFVILAGLMGAAGVILAAAGAHTAAGAGLEGAAYMLLFHAAAILGAGALTQQQVLWRPLTFAVLAAWFVGAALFAGDLTLRAFAGHRLFPLAAPTGGLVLIAGWLGVAAAGIGALLRG